MRKIISILALAAMAGTANAEWIKTVSNDDLDIYVDVGTVYRAGSKTKVWELYNYDSSQEANGKRYLSLKIQNEYDCKEPRVRALAGVGYARKMGEGDVRFTDNEPDKWGPVVPGTMGEGVWKLICGERQS